MYDPGSEEALDFMAQSISLIIRSLIVRLVTANAHHDLNLTLTCRGIERHRLQLPSTEFVSHITGHISESEVNVSPEQALSSRASGHLCRSRFRLRESPLISKTPSPLFIPLSS